MFIVEKIKNKILVIYLIWYIFSYVVSKDGNNKLLLVVWFGFDERVKLFSLIVIIEKIIKENKKK